MLTLSFSGNRYALRLAARPHGEPSLWNGADSNRALLPCCAHASGRSVSPVFPGCQLTVTTVCVLPVFPGCQNH